VKILFVVTGVGYGDAVRQHAIIEEFLKDKKNKVLVAAYDNSYDYFKKKYKTLEIGGYKFIDKNMKFKTFSFVLTNLFLPLTWARVNFELILKVKKFNPDVIISDFEPIGISLGKMLGKKCVSVFGYNPLVKIKKNFILKMQSLYLEYLYNRSDYVVIPSFLKFKDLERHIFVNPIVRAKKNKKVGFKKKPVLVMLGGSSFGVSLARKINNVADKFDEEFIIFGSNLNLDFKKNVKYVRFTESFYDYLNSCKALITLGGNLTLSEGAYFRKPMLCFPIKNHVEQLVNVESLKGVCVSYDLKDVEGKLKYFLGNLDKFKPLKMKFDGAKQVVKFVYSLNEK